MSIVQFHWGSSRSWELASYPLVAAHLISDAILLAGLEDLCQYPIRVCVQIREEGIRRGHTMDLRHIGGVAIGQHLAVYAAAADHPECEAVNGVEVACRLEDKEIHIVGLFIDPRSKPLLDMLEFCRNSRMRRNRDIFLKLRFLGYELSENMPEFNGKTLLDIGRPHFAKALVNHYAFPTLQSAFDKLLGYNKPAWVKRQYPLPEEVIKNIHLAGGVAVWAHPILRDVPDRAFLMRSCRRLKSMGLDGIEGFYSMFSARETLLVAEAAEKYGLKISGGSDFHGENRPNVVIGFGAGGLRVPDKLLYQLKECRAEKFL